MRGVTEQPGSARESSRDADGEESVAERGRRYLGMQGRSDESLSTVAWRFTWCGPPPKVVPVLAGVDCGRGSHGAGGGGV